MGEKHEYNIKLIPAYFVFYLFFFRDEDMSQSKVAHKKVTFNLSGDEDSEGEDMEDIFGGKTSSTAKSESKSSFEKRQEKVSRFQMLYIWCRQ